MKAPPCVWLSFTTTPAHSELPPPPPIRYGVPVIPTFAQSVPLHDNHIGTRMNPEQDCLHYCMPGVPQVREGGGTARIADQQGRCRTQHTLCTVKFTI